MPFFLTSSSICDTNGQLLFYTNGIYIANKNHDTLSNGSGFNPGNQTNDFYTDGLNVPQGAITIHRPGYTDHYYVFHESGELFVYDSILEQQPFHLGLTEIDMSLDGGLGGVIPNKKDLHIIEDTLMNGRLTACKHANGRDWWIITHRFRSNLFYNFLITPDSIFGPYSQNVGITLGYDATGHADISPDGSKYAMVAADNNLMLLNFDRCNGSFTLIDSIHVPNPTIGQADNEAFSCSFSPNSRFLYVITYTKIVQYDTWSANIAASGLYVAQWDTFSMPFYTYFNISQFAPDNKIYISTYGGCYLLHYINNPDSLGLACEVIQNSFILPRANIGLPNFPVFRLGPVTGSVCDSLYVSVTEKEKNDELDIYPNPILEWCKILIKDHPISFLEIQTMLGETIYKYQITQTNILNLDLSFLRPGIYYITVYSSDKKITRKIIKL